MLDPVVHAALVVVFAFLVKLLFTYVGLGNVGDNVFTGIAGAIVTYILSLFGYALYIKAKIKLFASKQDGIARQDFFYHPPFG